MINSHLYMCWINSPALSKTKDPESQNFSKWEFLKQKQNKTLLSKECVSGTFSKNLKENSLFPFNCKIPRKEQIGTLWRAKECLETVKQNEFSTHINFYEVIREGTALRKSW